MPQLFDPDLQLILKSRFLYVPLLFDPDVERELLETFHPDVPQRKRPPRKTDLVIEREAKYFVKAINVYSLLENYEKIYTDSYEQAKNACFKKCGYDPGSNDALVGENIRTILFRIMPHFIKKENKFEREKFTEEHVLDMIKRKVDIPNDIHTHAEKLFFLEPLRTLLSRLERKTPEVNTPADGLISGDELREWFQRKLEVRILETEKLRIKRLIREREHFIQTGKKYSLILLSIAEKGSLEMDGFGFFRVGTDDEYIIYKRTGEYALKDYYGRIYLFPDCRVAVSTRGILSPVVIEYYKHPFLYRHESWQKICMRHTRPYNLFTAENAINALEDGVNSLLYGYDYRRRNGYHSLDRIPVPEGLIKFDNYRVPSDHPKIISGEVRITNDFR